MIINYNQNIFLRTVADYVFCSVVENPAKLKTSTDCRKFMYYVYML